MKPVIKTTNQKLAVFNVTEGILPLVEPSKDIDQYGDAMSQKLTSLLVDPLFEPNVAGQPVTIENVTDPNNRFQLDKPSIESAVMNILTNTNTNVNLSEELKEVFSTAMRYRTVKDNIMPYEEQLITQEFGRAKLPLPSDSLLYTPRTDIIPAAKDLIATWEENELRQFIVAYAGVLLRRPIKQDICAVIVKDETVYQRILDSMKAYQIANQSTMVPDTVQNLNDAQNVKMKATDATTTILMPSYKEQDTYEQNSFMRILQHHIAEETKAKQQTGNPPVLHDVALMPLNMQAVIDPRAYLFINVNATANATDREISEDILNITKALDTVRKVNAVNMKRLSSATAITNARQKGHSAGVARSNNNQLEGRHARVKFRGKALSSKQQIGLMLNVMKKYTTNEQTSNVYLKTKHTFARQNRRQPDNPDAMGVSTRKNYRPDIHIYLDTSGSISEEQFKSAVSNLLIIAKKTGVDMYFSSFSHIISTPVRIRTKGKSLKQLYTEFQSIPKVTGGTNFENVWNSIDFIHETQKTTRINFIISDFEYSLSKSRRFVKGRNSMDTTFYVPIAVNGGKYQYIKSSAASMIKAMQYAGHTKARKHFLM